MCGRSGSGVPAWAARKKAWFGKWVRSKPFRFIWRPTRYLPTDLQRRRWSQGRRGGIGGRSSGSRRRRTWVASQRFQSSHEAGVERVQVDRAARGKVETHRKESTRKRTDVAITRRELFTTIAKAGVPAAVAITVGTGALQAEDDSRSQCRRWIALRRQHLHRLQSLRGSLRRGERHAARYPRRRTASGALRSERSHPQHHQALQARRRLRFLFCETPVHALPRSRPALPAVPSRRCTRIRRPAS